MILLHSRLLKVDQIRIELNAVSSGVGTVEFIKGSDVCLFALTSIDNTERAMFFKIVT